MSRRPYIFFPIAWPSPGLGLDKLRWVRAPVVRPVRRAPATLQRSKKTASLVPTAPFVPVTDWIPVFTESGTSSSALQPFVDWDC